MPVVKRKGHAASARHAQTASALRKGDDGDEYDFDLPGQDANRKSSPVVALSCLFPFVMLGVFISMLWYAFRRDHLPYALLPIAMDDATLRQAVELGQRVKASGAAEQKRAFGTGQLYLSQHSIVYLHGPSGDSADLRDIVAALRRIAETAARKHHWPLAPQPLVPRCIELIKYTSSAAGKNDSESIGWHDDGATHLTVAVPLDERSSYDGGKIEVVSVDGTTHVAWPRRGDAVVWRGWDRHRVLPITRGERNVLVGEFWSERSGQAWNRMDGRPLEDLQRYRDALKLDSRSAALQEGLGVIASKQGESDLAEASFRQAVSLNPHQASAFTGLGVVLQHEDKLKGAMAAIGLGGLKRSGPARAAEAEDALQLAIKLDPTMAAAPYDISLLFERSGRHSEAAAYKEAALHLDPDLLTGHQGEGESAASKLHS